MNAGVVVDEGCATSESRYFTPTDLGFNNVTWAAGGTNSFDIVCQGLRMFSMYAISDDNWSLRAEVYNETATAILYTTGFVYGDVGRFGGQVEYDHFVLGPFDFSGFFRIRFRGRGLFGVATANSTLRVYGRS